MTGIEKIVKHIWDNAEMAAKAVIAEANLEAGRVVADAKAEAESKCSEIRRQSALEVKACLDRAESAARLKERRLVLDAKQKMIDEVIVKARNYIAGLPEKQYFDLLLKMIGKYALCKPGIIVFSPADAARLPERFDAAIRSALSGKSGAELIVSEQTQNIDGGFVLIYGDIEENCSFDALFLADRELLQDKAGSLLFG